ncbi:hypothetical protein QR680_008812 [Steinernema hermaphroditum]|uniref:ELMO domain-containing protein n=1 Tax=Steinernema hermaphroditum TaxID=289476 RepID=A0AA39IK76_9BILA|nr:hypothetical protein QR680_008812 [Steinernema hermaphroditum]
MSSNFHTPSKPLNPVSIRPPENTVKGAVKLDPLMGQFLDVSWRYPSEDKCFQSTYSTFDKENDVLDEFISRLCESLRLPDFAPKRYGLLFESSKVFLSEENRSQVQQGFLLVLTASPENYVRVLLPKLTGAKSNSYQQEVSNTLQTLHKFSTDIVFAKVFHAEGGIANGLIPVIEKGTYAENAESLALVLQTFLQLMDHPDLVAWTSLSPDFVKKISTFITGKSKVENNTILQASLSIIDQILATKDAILTEVVKSEIPFESLIRHLEKSDERVLLNVLTLMVTLYNVADQASQVAISQHLNDSPYRLAIERTVLRESRSLDHYIQQQLAIIQRLQLNELGKIAQRKPLEQEITHLKNMKELNGESIMTKSTSGSMSGSTTTEFPYVVDWDLFADLISKTPPGLLAIDAILHCVEHHAEMLSQISIENKMRQNVNMWPFPIVAAHLVSVLIDLLDIVPSESEREHKLVVVLFNADKPFYELFAVSVYLFHRTWREMNAGVEDIQQVVAVVAEQLERSFRKNPKTFKQLDELLIQLNYPKMQEMWKRERSEREEIELQSDAIQELRVLLRPAMEELVKMNKKNCLKNGQTFIKVVRGKAIQKNLQYWNWKLDPNERIINYSDPKDDSAGHTIKVEDIQRIIHGAEYQEMLHQMAGKSSKKTTAPARFGFCLEVADNMEPFNLATEDEQVYCDWIDGLSALISSASSAMVFTESGEKEVERLLNFEIRTRLLEIETPPTSTLVVPELPTDFDWIPAVKMIDPDDDEDEVESLNGA